MLKLALALVAPVALLGPAPCFTPAKAQDAAALCAGKGTVDETQPIPDALAPEAARIFGIEDLGFVKKATVYRCVDDKIWLCNFGANLVCDKADRRRSNPGVVAWCRSHPGSADIPMAATGHATVYAWACAGTTPRITGTLQKIDARGYIAENWKALR
jgi:hypothetical protein